MTKIPQNTLKKKRGWQILHIPCHQAWQKTHEQTTNCVKTIHSAKDKGINDTQMGKIEVWFYMFYWKMGGQQ